MENKQDHDSPRRSFWKMFSNLKPHSSHSSWLWVTASKCLFFNVLINLLISRDVPVRKHTKILCLGHSNNKQQTLPWPWSALDRYFLDLLILCKSPQVCNQVNNAIRLYLEPKHKTKQHFTLTAPWAKIPQITEQTLSNSRIRGFIQPNSLQADCQ